MGNLNRFDLGRIVKEYKTNCMFETGTFWGDGVAYALQSPFTRIVSVEIIPEIAEKAKKRFIVEEKVDILITDSITALQEQLPKIKENIVFWLDAHFPGADAGLIAYDTGNDELFRLPLQKELEMICALRKNHQDVIIVDDLRIYEDGPYENGNVPADALPQQNRNADFIEKFFSETHFIFRSYLDEGYILIFPKKKYKWNHFKFLDLFKSGPALEDHYLMP